jgi:hypothetical protein
MSLSAFRGPMYLFWRKHDNRWTVRTFLDGLAFRDLDYEKVRIVGAIGYTGLHRRDTDPHAFLAFDDAELFIFAQSEHAEIRAPG